MGSKLIIPLGPNAIEFAKTQIASTAPTALVYARPASTDMPSRKYLIMKANVSKFLFTYPTV